MIAKNVSASSAAGCPARRILRKRVIWPVLVLGLAAGPAIGAGTWTPLTNLPPATVGLMLQSSDGTVMAHNNGGSAWYRLTPDSAGHYVNGTWTTLQPMPDTRLYYASQVLKDGRVFLAGGEYGTGYRTGESYNPLTNKWTMAPPPATSQGFSDCDSTILPDGRVLIAPVSASPFLSTIIWSPTTNTWTTGPSVLGNQNEAAWVKLPDDSILTVNIGSTNSERYIPSLNQWVADATVPVALYDPYGFETGAAFLLPNGKVFFLGSLSHTAIYTPSGTNSPGSWIAGPDIPTPTGAPVNHSSYFGTMLCLPDGTALYADFNRQIYSYQPDGVPVASGKPAITTIAQNADGTFHMVGTQLNGISEGSCYGDDNQNASNYPIVRLISGGGTVYGARTFNWSRTSVQTGATPVSTEFAVPQTIPAGTYSLTVTANGIGSDAVVFSFTPILVAIPASATEGGAAVTGTITLTLTASANTQAVGTYTATLTFNNTTSGDGNTSRIVNLIVSGAPVMAVTAGSLNSTGPAGGAFTPSSTGFTISNSGSGPLSWTATKTAAWLTLSPSSGTINPGLNTTVTATIGSGANSLAQGSYSDTIAFTNTNNGTGNTTRAASLLVQTKAFTYDLTTNPGWTTQGVWHCLQDDVRGCVHHTGVLHGHDRSRWGANGSGQIGDGTTTNRSLLTVVGSTTTWSKLATGSTFATALRSDGTLWSWGLNWSGQLGDGSLVNRGQWQLLRRPENRRHPLDLGSQHQRPARRWQHDDAHAPGPGGHGYRLEIVRRWIESCRRAEIQRHALELGPQQQRPARRWHHHAAHQSRASGRRDRLEQHRNGAVAYLRRARDRYALVLGKQHERAAWRRHLHPATHFARAGPRLRR